MLSVRFLSEFTMNLLVFQWDAQASNIAVQWVAIKPIKVRKVRFFIVSSVLEFHGNLKETTCNSQPSSSTMAKPVGKP